MKMKTKIISLVLVVMMVFTGCATCDTDIVVNSNGSGSVKMTMQIDKQAYVDYMNQMAKEVGTSMTEAEIDEALTSEGYKLVTIDGKEYYQVSEKEKIKKGNLQKYFGDSENVSYMTTDTVYLEMNTSTSQPALTGEEMLTLEAMGIDANAMSDVGMTLTVTMPKKVVRTNGTIDKQNPNKVSFKMDMGKNNVIFATTKSGVTKKSIKAKIKKLNSVKATSIKKIKANKVKAKAKTASVTLKFKKVKVAKKYQIEYSTKKNFKNAKSKYTKKTTYTIKNLKKGTKYYVRVRAVKKNYADVDVHSKWAKKSVTTKK